MKQVSFEEIIGNAESYCEKGIVWHHHFLPPKCALNKDKSFQITLENEETGESFFSLFNERPMRELKLLEDLFFNRKK